MAAVVPLQTRIDQYKAETNVIIGRAKQVSLELQVQWRRGIHLSYEISPLLTRIDFLADIPMKIFDLAVSIFKTIMSAVGCMASFGLNSEANKRLSIYATQVATTPIEICLLFYAAINPQTGIDKYCDYRERQIL